MRLRLTRQRGFTLIELMMAGMISFLLAMVCVSMLRQSSDLNTGLKARLRLNAQARQAFEVIGNGGEMPAGTTGGDGTRNIYGIHGRFIPQANTALRQNYQLVLSSNGQQIAGDSFSAKTVTCKGPKDPLPDCATAGTQKTVTGWLGDDPTINYQNRSAAGYTAEATITLTDAARAVRIKKPADATDTYRNGFTMNREVQSDP